MKNHKRTKKKKNYRKLEEIKKISDVGMRKGLTEGMDKQKFQEAKQARIEIEYFKKGNEHGHE